MTALMLYLASVLLVTFLAMIGHSVDRRAVAVNNEEVLIAICTMLIPFINLWLACLMIGVIWRSKPVVAWRRQPFGKAKPVKVPE